MSESIIIKKPFDAHVHIRRGATLRAVAPIVAEKFCAAIVMPNTDPILATINDAEENKKEILSALPKNTKFQPLMTLYFTKSLTAKDIERIASAKEKLIYGIKYYPWGYSINSQWGPNHPADLPEVLQEMEKAGIPLLLHSEVHVNSENEEEDPYDGEKLFLEETLPRLLDQYPRLRVSLEHMSSKLGADFMEKNGDADRLVATITPHHLVYDRKDAFRTGYRALLNCKPLIKRTEDRDALKELVKNGLPFIHAGTDSAPHPESRKFSSCCVYGAFNSPVAVELYTQVFDEMNALDKLENFLSVNGPRFFGVEPSTEKITLIKKDWQLADPVVTDEGVRIWPIGHRDHGLGNEVIRWQIQN